MFRYEGNSGGLSGKILMKSYRGPVGDPAGKDNGEHVGNPAGKTPVESYGGPAGKNNGEHVGNPAGKNPVESYGGPVVKDFGKRSVGSALDSTVERSGDRAMSCPGGAVSKSSGMGSGNGSGAIVAESNGMNGSGAIVGKISGQEALSGAERSPVGKRVLVTGADGMLGNNIVRELLARGHAVSCFIEKDHDGRTLTELPVKVTRGNICDESHLVPFFRENDYVIHTAGVTTMWPARSALSWRINYDAVKLLVRLSRENGIRRFIHIGTATSFGHGTIDDPGTEETPYSNHIFGLDYQDSKYGAQEYLLEEHRRDGFPVVILNPTFMFGRYDNGNSSNKMILYMYKGKVPGYSPGGKNYVHVRDVAHAAANALTMGREGECYITGGMNMTYRESFRMIAETLGVKPPRIAMPRFVSVAFGGVQSVFAAVTGRPPAVSYKMARIGCEGCYYSPEKAIRELKMPQTPLEHGVLESIDWFREKGMV
jgi:dihydroflavonol-4-reductase